MNESFEGIETGHDIMDKMNAMVTKSSELFHEGDIVGYLERHNQIQQWVRDATEHILKN